MLDTNWLQKVKSFWNLESGGVYKLYGCTCNIEGDDNRSNALKFLGSKKSYKSIHSLKNSAFLMHPTERIFSLGIKFLGTFTCAMTAMPFYNLRADFCSLIGNRKS